MTVMRTILHALRCAPMFMLCQSDPQNTPAREASDAHSAAVQIIRADVADKESGPSKTRVVIVLREDGLWGNDAPGVGWRQQVSLVNVGLQGTMTANNWGVGAEHAFKGKWPSLGTGAFVFDVEGDSSFPLTFKITKEGYAYLYGRGTITVSGAEQRLVLGQGKTEKDWISGLRSKHQLIREGSAEALGWLKIKEGVPFLIMALGDSSWEVRRNSAEALGLIGDRSAEPALKEAVEDPVAEVRKVVEEALERLRDKQSGKEKSTPAMLMGDWAPKP